ncbi:DDE-type integrase/transposase/recombinase [Paenibacillus sp. NPDC056933]|uniref:DDE-type integrase/transposase/recombinase n=1 Tax=Paenibacillus sp. NPDC056933 TaxID=3345968 RepID=UPI0036394FCD
MALELMVDERELSTVWEVSRGERNDNELVLRTFSKAFAKQKDVTGLVVHSDQVFQYTSHAYHDMLLKVGARISMSRRGNCYDDASM